MTEFELVEVIPLYVGTGQGAANATLALLFGYLVAAYAVGANLTRAQFLIGNLLYVGSVGLTTVGGIGAMSRAAHFANKLQAMKPDENIILAQFNPVISYLIVLLSVWASLWFMWSVRHPKTD